MPAGRQVDSCGFADKIKKCYYPPMSSLDAEPEPKDLYRGQARQFADFIENSFSWTYIEGPTLERCLGNLKLNTLHILDAGCGSGRSIDLLLAKGANPGNILGVDSSNELLAIARTKYSKVKFEHEDLTKISLPEGNFDLIVCSLVLNHVDNDAFKILLKKFHSWLIDGGTLVYVTGHPVRMVRDDLSSYFSRELMEVDTPWGTRTTYFQKPLSDYFNKTIATGFDVTYIDEGEIPEEGKSDPKGYARYIVSPARLGVRAVKR
ncbi:MAG: type 11 methyltransferase [Microgenomates group bacterium Gr01-1014_80]|nr:MAG: type 11 methyltransferase [Microgenomates group bacterium Gr01-1014_80]